MSEVKDRIRELIDNSGLSNKDFAEKVDINPAIISHILSGRNNPSLHVIQQITKVYTNVNTDYLLTGRGNLFNDRSTAHNQEAKQESPSSFAPQDAVRRVAPPGSTPLPKRELSVTQQERPKQDVPAEPRKQKEENNPFTNVNTNVNRAGKQIERVIIFYSDKSMEEYRP